jgi:N-acetylmuramoyl-L-alanine amidase
MPSVLIEAGFLSNSYEANYMNSEDGQAYLASAIYRAVRDYKKAVDHKSDYKLLASNTAAETLVIKQPQQEIATIDGQVEDIFFRIQLAATSKKIEPSASNFKGLNNVERIQVNPVHKYFYGKTNSFEEIQALKNQIVSLFPDAFIVAFEQDETIPLKKALRKIKP